MVTIVGKDTSKVKRTTCCSCASILEFTRSETREGKRCDYTGDCDRVRLINCPACGEELVVG